MTLIDDARARALVLDGAITEQIRQMRLSQSRELVSELRAYLDKQDRAVGVGNNVFTLLKRFSNPSGVVQINLGTPSIDRTSSAFMLRSGSRLTFGLTLRDEGQRSSLMAYKFQIQFPHHYSPSYLRFDLIQRQHEVPLRESRSHLHPGTGDIRIPTPALQPLEVLDRIFFVVEPAIK